MQCLLIYLQASASACVANYLSIKRHSTGQIEARTNNSTYKKLSVQWLNKALCFVSGLVLKHSFRFRNRQLLAAAKPSGCEKTNLDFLKTKTRFTGFLTKLF